MNIRLDNLTVTFDDRFQMDEINWQIEDNQHWVITGANGSGKSALAAILAGAGKRMRGTIEGVPAKVGLVSFEAQAELIERERKKDDADIMDVIAVGTPVRQILTEGGRNPERVEQLVALFKLDGLMDRAFRKLSTGESRKVMLVRALASEPDLLVLDEPFDGLDALTLEMLQQYLVDHVNAVQMVMVLNRFDEFPDFITHIAYVDQARLQQKIHKNDTPAYDKLYQLLHLKTTDLKVPAGDPDTAAPKLDPTQPLVKLNSINITYDGHRVVNSLDWTIEPNQHWQLSGPNGSGKTGVLSLITGDHPQCYVNDIFVFGFQRGKGESIWQIKQFIGYVSTALQWEYKVGTSLRNVIVSGFYDSIGLYTKATDRQKKIADEWLALMGLAKRADTPFNKLSYGDQRLVLIARAMVKHPPLLILDEPCLGLDDMNRQLVLALIEKICAASETAVLYVNHHAEDKINGIENYLTLEKREPADLD